MKNKLKIFMFAIISFLFIGNVKANNINNINMDIYIDSKGDAHVTETWNASLTEGTEGYRYYGNLGNSTIEDYSVSDETRSYTSLGSWDIYASFDEKAYKSGIHDTGDHKELCFGISEYGTHSYKLKYTITGFVAETSDSQIVYWELIPTDLAKLTDKVYIKIHADEAFKDTLDVWGYGNYGGYAYVADGVIELSNDSLDEDEYITVLVKFDKGTFTTANVVENDFNHYHNMAEEGAEHYTSGDSESSSFDIIIGIFSFLFTIIPFLIIVIVIVIASKSEANKVGSYQLDYGINGKIFNKDLNYFRNLPCDKDIFKGYWLARAYKIYKKETDFLGAILLKWLKNGNIKTDKIESGKLIKKEENTITFISKDNLKDIEIELYDMMYEASIDGILESKEFEKWCKNHYSKILKWFDKVLDDQTKEFIAQGLLKPIEVTTMKIFKSTKYQIDNSLFEEAKQVKGLQKFLIEFSSIDTKEAIEVKLWEEYLMFAQIFGIADKVAKQFKKLYPDALTNGEYNYDYDTFIFINMISRSGMVSASSAKSKAESYSSGGGGFSSGGGGGGSFGGGGGGGFR